VIPGTEGDEEIARGERGTNVRRLALGAAAAFALALASAGAANAASTSADVIIEPNAQYDVHGAILHVEVKVTCTGGSGLVVVDVNQSPPETPYPVGFGSGPNPVVCDGRTHETGVTIQGLGFDAGKAMATATLTSPSGSDTDKRMIDIRVV
jgi:hypothetical protein